MRKMMLILAMAVLMGGCARKDWMEQCNEHTQLLESGFLDPAKENCASINADCVRALKQNPNDTKVLINIGKTVWIYGLKDEACKDFALALAMGDNSAFLQYCNPDGSPKEQE